MQGREAKELCSQDEIMNLFDPKAPLLMTIAETFTSDLKTGFTGQRNQTVGIAMEFENLEKMSLKKSYFLLRFITLGNKAISGEAGVKYFLLISHIATEMDTRTGVRIKCSYQNSCGL